MRWSVSTFSAIAVVVWLLFGMLPPHTLGQSPDEETLFTVAAQAYQDGLLDLAREQLQAYLTAYPRGKHLAAVYYLLGDYFYRKGDYAQAVRYLQNALQHRPQQTLGDDAQYLLGRSYFEKGNYAEARQAFQPLREQGRRGRWYAATLYWTGEALLSLGDFDGAARLLHQLTEEFPASEYMEHALYSLGYAWQKVDAHDAGLQAFQQLLQRFPQSQLRRSAEYGIARALVALQRYEAAAPHWERLQQDESAPQRAAEATFWWGVSWARAGQCEPARSAFRAYLTRFPQGQQRAEALAALAECAETVGDVAEAIKAYEELWHQFPEAPRRDAILLHLADAYSRASQLAQAHHAYSQWLVTFPNSPRLVDVLIRRGLISYQQRDYAQAAQDFVAVSQRTNDAQQQTLVHTILAESYFRLDNCGAALPHLSAVIEGGDADAQRLSRLRRGVCAYRGQAFAAAVEDLGQLADDTAFRGDRQGLLLLLGQSLAALDRHEEAVGRLRQFLATAPTDGVLAEGLASLGASLLKIGRSAEALPVYERLLSVAPGLVGEERLQLQLGHLYRERQETEKAKIHLRAAIAGRDEPVVAEALYHLAEVLLTEGGEEEGRALLQKLTTQFASQARWVAIAYYRLALVYEEAEQWPEAWKAYRGAAETALDAKLVEAARERAKHLEETVDVHARQEPTASEREGASGQGPKTTRP